MYQDRYYVPKSTETHADCLMAWGLAKVLSHLLIEAGQPNADKVTVCEEAAYFVVELPYPFRREWLEQSQKPQLTYFVVTRAEKDSTQSEAEQDFKAKKKQAIPTGPNIISLEQEKERSKRRKEAKKSGLDTQQDEESKASWASLQPHRYYHHARGFNTLKAATQINNLYANWEQADHVQVLQWLLSRFAGEAKSGQESKQKGEKAKSFVAANAANTVVILNPSQGTGTNTQAPKGQQSSNIPSPWPVEWLKLVGFHAAGIYVDWQKKGDGKTVAAEVLVLRPRRISIKNHARVLDAFQNTFFQNAGSSVKLECLAALRYANEYLTRATFDEDLPSLSKRRVSNAVSGFDSALFMDVRQGVNFAVKRITFLAMPMWIQMPADGSVDRIRDAVEKHIEVLRPLDDSRGETRALMDAYLAWSSSGDLRRFWEFCAGYGAYRMERASKGEPCRALTTKNLEVVLMNQSNGEKKLAPIIRDEHFQNVASAVRQSTINALLWEKNPKKPGRKLPSGMEVRYGLAQEWRRAAPYRDKFVGEVMKFLQQYSEQKAKVRSRDPENKNKYWLPELTTRDVERIVELIDDDQYGPETMCGLLLAYGYASDYKPKKPGDGNADGDSDDDQDSQQDDQNDGEADQF